MATREELNGLLNRVHQGAALEEAQAGIKITGRNINNLRYVDDITLMAESEGKLKSVIVVTVSPSICH